MLIPSISILHSRSQACTLKPCGRSISTSISHAKTNLLKRATSKLKNVSEKTPFRSVLNAVSTFSAMANNSAFNVSGIASCQVSWLRPSQNWAKTSCTKLPRSITSKPLTGSPRLLAFKRYW